MTSNKQKVDELLEKTTPRAVLKKKILAATKKQPNITLLELGRLVYAPIADLEQAVFDLQHEGYEFRVAEETIERDLLPPPAQAKSHFWRIRKSKPLKLGIVTDTHLGSTHARLDALNTAYDHFAAEGITRVYHGGNFIDGYKVGINEFELVEEAGPSIERQINYAARVYPQKPGIKTYFVTGECYDDKTEVMTRSRGFVKFRELAPEDEVATLNLDGLMWEWQRPTEHIKKPYRGELYRFKTQKIDAVVTPGHEMLFRHRQRGGIEKIAAKNFKRGNYRFLRGCNWDGINSKNIALPRVKISHPWSVKYNYDYHPAKLMMALVGWYLAEGSADKYRVSIAQSEESPHYKEIESLIRELGYSPKCSKKEIRFGSKRMAAFLGGLGLSHEKRIPGNLKKLHPALLSELISAYWKGDGYYKNGKMVCATTVSYQLACDLVECLMKCGHAAMFSAWDRPAGQLINGKKVRTRKRQYNVYVSRNLEPHYRGKPTKVNYAGYVYCVRVPNGTILLRRSGKVFWGANCHEGWWIKKSGLNIGRLMESRFKERGREDLEYLGHLEADIELRTSNLAKKQRGPIMRLFHPGGGSAYALSYKAQKISESLQGGEKPQIQVITHFHKFDYNYAREIHNVLGGCLQDQTTFMRQRHIDAHVGYLIFEIKIAADGVVESFKPEFKPFYDRGFYKDYDRK